MTRRARRPNRRRLGRRGAERCARQRRPRAARKPDRRRGDRRCSPIPRPGTRRFSCCVGATQPEYEPVWPPTLMMNKATATRRAPPDAHVGRRAARDRPGRARRGRRRRCSRPTGTTARARRRLGRPARERRDRGARGEPRGVRGKAIGVCVEGRDRTRRAALVERRERCQTRSTAGLSAHRRASRRGDTAYPLDPPFLAAWDPVPRAHQDATVVVVRSDDGVEGYASGGDVPDLELLERLLARRRRDRCRRRCTRVLETVDFHRGRNWTLEVAVWDLVGRARGEPVWRLLGGTRERMLAYASTGELVSRRSACAGAVALRDAGVRAVEDPPALRGLAARPAGRRGASGTPSETTSRSWSTRTRAGACRATRRRAGISRPPPSSSASSSDSTSTGSRSRLPTDDLEGYAALSRERSPASPPARWCGRQPRRET